MITWLVITALVFAVVNRAVLGYPKPRREFKVLARREAAFLNATAEVLFPPDGAIPFSGLDADIPSYADRFLSALEPRVRLQIRLLFAFFEHVTLFIPASGLTGFRRFSALSFEQRELVMQGWSQSPNFWRQLIFTALRAVLTMGYLGHPVVARHLRVAPYAIDTPICEADLLYPAIGTHPRDISLTRADLTRPSDGTPIDIDGPLDPTYLEPSVRDDLERASSEHAPVGGAR